MLATGRGDGAILIVLTATTAVVSRASRAPAVAQVLFVALLTVASYVIAFGGVRSAALDSAVAHFVLPAAAAPLLLGAALRSGVVAWPRSGRHGADLALIFVAAGLTIAVGAAWELVEFACDSLFGTDMAQGYDAIRDLTADAAGAVTGAVPAGRSLAAPIRWPAGVAAASAHRPRQRGVRKAQATGAGSRPATLRSSVGRWSPGLGRRYPRAAWRLDGRHSLPPRGVGTPSALS
jgi:hypothetical protein